MADIGKKLDAINKNFGKLNSKVDELIDVTREQQLSFTVETHHATRYR